MFDLDSDTAADRSEDAFPAPIDTLLGEAGFPKRVVREIRGYAPGSDG